MSAFVRARRRIAKCARRDRLSPTLIDRNRFSKDQRLEVMTANALRDSVKGLNAEDSRDDLAEAVVRMEGEKPFGLPGISVPHSLELSATIQREVGMVHRA
jgi:hypothetical protein